MKKLERSLISKDLSFKLLGGQILYKIPGPIKNGVIV